MATATRPSSLPPLACALLLSACTPSMPLVVAQFVALPLPSPCPSGRDCVGQQLGPRNAILCTLPEFAGFTCGGGSNLTLCPSGQVCPDAVTQLVCPAGGWCPQGSSKPFDCAVGGLCGEGSYKMTYVLFLIIYLLVLFGLVGAYYLARRRNRNRVYVAEGFDELRTLGTAKSSAGDDDLPLPMRIKMTIERVSVQVADENKSGGGGGNTDANATAAAASVAAAIGKKTILHNISGTIRGGRLTAIMGASGAGKTTFLSALLGRIPVSAGQIRINSQYTAAEMGAKNLIAFVPQDDTMLSMLTVRDLLTHSAMTRLPGTMSHAAKRRRVDRTLALLGLEHVADRAVGDETQRGVSGGEKKRCSIGIELVAEPLLLMLDEPTSGLDSAAALQVCACLRRIASRQMLVASVIHSPRYEIFQQFDDLVLLGRGGHLVYFGPVANVRAYFASMGFLVPLHCNPADFFLDVISEPEFVERFVAGGCQAFMGPGRGGFMGKNFATGGDAAAASAVVAPAASAASNAAGLRHRQQSSVAGSIVKPLDPALINADSDADSPISGGNGDSNIDGGDGGKKADGSGGGDGKKLNVLVELSPLQPFHQPQSPVQQVPTFTALPASSLGASANEAPYALRAPSLLGAESSTGASASNAAARTSNTPSVACAAPHEHPSALVLSTNVTADGTVLSPHSPSPVSSPSNSDVGAASASPSPNANGHGHGQGHGRHGAGERAPMLRAGTTSDACALAPRVPAPFFWQLWYCLRRCVLQDMRYPRYVLIDSLLQTLPGIALAFPFLGKDMYTPPLPLSVALDCPSMVLERCLGATLYSAYFVVPFFFHCMIIGAASQIYSVASFGRHMAVYRRERGAGLDRVAFFLAKNVYDLLHITRASWIFIACYFLLNAPVGDLGSWIALLWCMYWAGFGCGYFISFAVRFELAPTIAVCAGICFSVTSGLSPSLDTVGQWGPLRIVWWLSYARWACEAMMLLSSSGQETAGRMDDAVRAAAYEPGNVPLDIGMVFLIGVVWRILTALAMWRKK